MNWIVLIYDYFNILTRIEVKDTLTKANQCGKFYTKRGGWYNIVEYNEENLEMYNKLLNM